MKPLLVARCAGGSDAVERHGERRPRTQWASPSLHVASPSSDVHVGREEGPRPGVRGRGLLSVAERAICNAADETRLTTQVTRFRFGGGNHQAS